MQVSINGVPVFQLAPRPIQGLRILGARWAHDRFYKVLADTSENLLLNLIFIIAYVEIMGLLRRQIDLNMN